MRELFEKIGEEIERGRPRRTGCRPALVLTGGGSSLAGSAELGREVLQMPVRVAAPTGVGGLTDHLLTPAFCTSIGLLMWAARVVDERTSRGATSRPPPAGRWGVCGTGCGRSSRSGSSP